ncbi:TIM44-like domain-containing protein [Sansalvadorimonas sp. 2012CJ34-2]|uniref:TIM44-like domain-containing protein n=1 Tax=Parendozoicomonas callyspongiae TaxID=2942213 RepID=A0ABT0PLC5_9GAMM|nr:TIM44-like domain-containing protein [Sansalvadorimonas sp. 2012CJ34-2]MCL6271537.1 TIM44-like domain-containing protein [Sansalvadorimonas sp. 2012CJ34-2]
MRRVLPVLAVLLAFTCTLTSMDAEAKKFGSSKSFGKTFKVAPSQPKNITSPSFGNTASKSTTQSGFGQNQTKKKGFFSGFGGGLLGGLLAGGLIASLFGGMPFHGMQFMDILILAAIAFIVIKLFRGMSRAKASALNGGHSQHYDSGASSWQQNQNNQNQSYRDFGFDAVNKQEPQSYQQDAGFGAHSDVPFNLPPDFDLNGFLNRARSHYKQIQDAWNSGDMSTIREYIAPDLYNHLEKERQALKGDQHTEVMYVDAELVRAEIAFGKAEVSLRFSGRYRDNVERIEEKITDIWHLERDLNQPNAPWLIVGLEYADD